MPVLNYVTVASDASCGEKATGYAYYLNKWCDINARAMMKHNRLHIDRKDWKRK